VENAVETRANKRERECEEKDRNLAGISSVFLVHSIVPTSTPTCLQGGEGRGDGRG